MRLHGYFQSAASWRVRIALALKHLDAEHTCHHLPSGRQRTPDYLSLNPQGVVPALELADGTVLTQSMAIIEWLDEKHPEPPLLPADPAARAKVRAFALVLAADTHPLHTLKVLTRLRAFSGAEDDIQGWAAAANQAGLEACERLAAPAPFCFGTTPGLADICLVPQLGSARRFGVDIDRFPNLIAVEAACLALPAFILASPERQADAG